jgi:hypothetical protein
MKLLAILFLLMVFACLVPIGEQAQQTQTLKPTKIDNKWGYTNSRGELVIPPQFDIALDFKNDFARVGVTDTEKRGLGWRSDYKWGFMDIKGRIIVELKYAEVDDFSEGLATVSLRDHSRLCGTVSYGYVDTTGAVIIEPKFAFAGSFRNGRARVGVGKIKYAGRCLCCAPQFAGQYGYTDKGGNFVPDAKE